MERLLALVDVLYEGMLDEEAWQKSLRAVSDSFGGGSLALFSMNPATGRVYRADVLNNDPAVMQEYGARWLAEDPRHAVGLTRPVGVPQTEETLVRWREFVRTPVFNDFLRPAGIELFMATWIERGPQRGVVLSLQRPLSARPFDAEDRRRMAVLAPHIRRVVEVKDRLAVAEISAATLLETMDRLPFGVVLLDAKHGVVEASDSVRRLLARGDGLRLEDGRLRAETSADSRLLAARLERAMDVDAQDDLVRVHRHSGRRSLSLLVLPLATDATAWLGAAARWMILVFDPEHATSPRADALRRVLEITVAEAVLTEKLAAGLSLAVAAEQLGISINTARSQLKSVFAKTGTNTQAQLVRAVMAGPAALFRGSPEGKSRGQFQRRSTSKP